MESKKYWDDRYINGSNSGNGSYGEQLEKKLAWLRQIDGVTSITEIGCGDFNFGKHVLELFPGAHYIGTDISKFIVDKNKTAHPEHVFTISEGVPPADLIMCVDVLFHILNDDEVEELLSKIEKSWTKYLVITAYERVEEMHNHVRIRNFDYKRFGEPIIREIVEEDGQLYFYLFRK